MRKLLLTAAVLAALSAQAQAQCDWRDFRDVKLYVDLYGRADINQAPVRFDNPPQKCLDGTYFYFDGDEKVYWYRDGHQDIYYVDYSRRDYTVLNVVDDRRADRKVDFFQIVQCEPNTITVWTGDGIANICRPATHVDYRFRDYHSDYDRPHPPHPDDMDRPHADRPHDDHADRPHNDNRPHDDHADRPHNDNRPHDDHADRPHDDNRPHDDHADRPHDDNRQNGNDNRNEDSDRSSHGRSGTHSSNSTTI